MIVLEESKKQSLHESVDLIHSKVLEDVRNVLSSNKKFKIAVAGKGTLTQYDDEGMQTIKEIPFNFSVTNATAKVQVGDIEISIDTILIKMAQLNKRKSVLDQMRKQLPKAREEQHSYMSRNAVPEYRYINYDLKLIKKEYEAVSKTIMEMQMALDKYNQTVQFEVDI